MVDVMVIYHRLEPRDFDAAYRAYAGDGSPPERKSGRRAEAVLRILNGQLKSASTLPREPAALSRWSRGVPEDAIDDDGRFTQLDSGEIIFNFGKHAGETVAEVAKTDFEYLSWVASNPNFSARARRIVMEAMEDAESGQ